MNSKKATGITLFIFWAIVTALLVAGLVFYQNNNLPKTPVDRTNAAGESASTTVSFSLATVALHNSPTDCWTAINGKVYDVTSLVNSHSGGAQAILSSCGRDSSVDFNTKDRNPARSHSGNAQAVLQSFYVGDLSQ